MTIRNKILTCFWYSTVLMITLMTNVTSVIDVLPSQSDDQIIDAQYIVKHWHVFYIQYYWWSFWWTRLYQTLMFSQSQKNGQTIDYQSDFKQWHPFVHLVINITDDNFDEQDDIRLWWSPKVKETVKLLIINPLSNTDFLLIIWHILMKLLNFEEDKKRKVQCWNSRIAVRIIVDQNFVLLGWVILGNEFC